DRKAGVSGAETLCERNEGASFEGLRASTVRSGALRTTVGLIAGLSGCRAIGLFGDGGALAISLRMIVAGAGEAGELRSLPLTPTLSRAARGEGVGGREGVRVGVGVGSARGVELTSPRVARERVSPGAFSRTLNVSSNRANARTSCAGWADGSPGEGS